MSDTEQSAAFAIAFAKERNSAEVTPDDLLLGALRAVSRFGVVRLGGLLLDLEELGVDWCRPPEKDGRKVAYSLATVVIFDRAARIARGDGAGAMRVEHLLVAFSDENTGLLGRIKHRYGITGTAWRAGIGDFASARATPEPGQSVIDTVSGSSSAPREFLTPEEAAEALGIHVQTLRGYVRSGKLPALRVAGERSLRIRRTDLEMVLEPLNA